MWTKGSETNLWLPKHNHLSMFHILLPGAMAASCVCPDTQGNEEVKARKEKNCAEPRKCYSVTRVGRSR